MADYIFFTEVFTLEGLTDNKWILDQVMSWCLMALSLYWIQCWPGPWFNIKMSSCQCRKSHCGDKTVVRSSYLYNGISYTGKMSSLYWIGALDLWHHIESPGHSKLTHSGLVMHVWIFELGHHKFRLWLDACSSWSHYLIWTSATFLFFVSWTLGLSIGWTNFGEIWIKKLYFP